jgi:hypothetical protein
LYPADFRAVAALAVGVLVVTLISLAAWRRPLMALAAAASIALTGYTVYISREGNSPGFAPYGPGYWLSLAAAPVMALAAGIASTIRVQVAGGFRGGDSGDCDQQDGGGDRAQQRVGGGGQPGCGGEQVVQAAGVGAFVGQQHLPLGRAEGAQHPGGDHDPAGPAGQGVGVGGVVSG